MSESSDKDSGDVGKRTSSLNDLDEIKNKEKDKKEDKIKENTKNSSFNSFFSNINGLFQIQDLNHHADHEVPEKKQSEKNETSKTESQKPGVSEGERESQMSGVSEGERESQMSGVSEGERESQKHDVSKNKHENSKSEVSKSPKPSKDFEEQDDHAFPFVEHLMSHESFRTLKSNKERITQGIALIVGVVLMIYGSIIITSSVTQVADNVIFGEKAMFGAFLILVGVLIIAAAFAQKLLSGTFLKKIHSELEVVEGIEKDSVDTSNGKSKDTVDGNDNKVNKNNITGENKK